jgi:hypothetical protein
MAGVFLCRDAPAGSGHYSIRQSGDCVRSTDPMYLEGQLGHPSNQKGDDHMETHGMIIPILLCLAWATLNF